MAELDNIASELLKSANEADKNYAKTRDQSQRDKAIRLRRIVENLKNLVLGASDLNGLSDVTISAPANAQVLTYNSTTGQWENQTPAAGGGGDMLKSTYDVDNTGVVDNAEAISIIGRNSTGATLYKGTVVYISGSTGNRPNFAKAQANAESTSAGTFGVVRADIANNSDGYVVCIGYIDNLDTRSTAPNPFTNVTLADGDTVYLHPTIAGYITNVKPSAPNHVVYVGKVTRTSPTNGTIVYRIQNGYELDEIHDVAISSKANNDLLVYESATSLWKNKTFAAIFGGTPLVSVPTLDQVTTAGNTTTNAITVGGLNVNGIQVITSADVANRDVGPAAFNITNGTFSRFNVVYDASIARINILGTSTEGLRIEGGSGSSITKIGSGGITISAPSNNLYLNGASLLFATGNVERARVNSNGNFLIGTTTDAGYKLDVNGSGRVKGLDNSSSTTAFLVQNTGGWDNLKVTNDGQVSIGGDGLTTFPLRVYGNSGLQIQVGNSLFSYNAVRTIRFLNANNGIPLNHEVVNQVTGTDNSNYVYFRNQTIQTAGSNADWAGISIETIVNTQTSAKVTQLLIKPTYNLQANTTSASIQRGIYYNPTITTLQTAIHRAIETTSGDVIFNGGFIGVGTTTPQSPAGYNGITINSASSGSYVWFQTGGTNRYSIGSEGGDIWHNIFAGANTYFRTGGNYWLTIAATTGNILIGTTTDAGYKLDVAGTVRAQVSLSGIPNIIHVSNLQTDGGPGGAIAFYTGGVVGNASRITAQRSGPVGQSDIALETNGITRLFVSALGNVGVGTSSPSYPFHISSSAAANIFATVQATNASASAAWVGFNDQSDNIVYRVFGSSVSGTQFGQSLTRSASLIANLGGTGKFLIGTYSSTDLVFGTGDQSRMRLVDSTGNFLVGTMTDAGNKLEVSGTINATAYKINGVSGWSGIINIPTMPPISITVDNGIITNVM